MAALTIPPPILPSCASGSVTGDVPLSRRVEKPFAVAVPATPAAAAAPQSSVGSPNVAYVPQPAKLRKVVEKAFARIVHWNVEFAAGDVGNAEKMTAVMTADAARRVCPDDEPVVVVGAKVLAVQNISPFTMFADAEWFSPSEDQLVVSNGGTAGSILIPPGDRAFDGFGEWHRSTEDLQFLYGKAGCLVGLTEERLREGVSEESESRVGIKPNSEIALVFQLYTGTDALSSLRLGFDTIWANVKKDLQAVCKLAIPPSKLSVKFSAADPAAWATKEGSAEERCSVSLTLQLVMMRCV